MLVCLTVDESLDPVVLLPGLEADEVHAPLPVDIVDIIDIVDSTGSLAQPPCRAVDISGLCL